VVYRTRSLAAERMCTAFTLRRYDAMMSDFPQELDHRFSALIGVEVKGEMWACVEMPGSADFFGTKKSIRVSGDVDGISFIDKGFMVTGAGGHMLSLDAKLRKQLGKDVGDTVEVHLTTRSR